MFWLAGVHHRSSLYPNPHISGIRDNGGYKNSALVERGRCIIPKYIHHFRGHLSGKFAAHGFEDGFRCASMPAAGIGEQEYDMWVFYSEVFAWFVPGSIFFIRLASSRRGSSTLCPQVWQTNPISAPIRTTFQAYFHRDAVFAVRPYRPV